MSALNSTTPYFGGLPTEPDVKRLVEKFGVPDVGKVIGYEEIVSTIGEKYSTHRWRTVVGAWRRLMEAKHNILLRSNREKAFEVCNNRDKVHVGVWHMRSSLRKARRATRVCMLADVSALSADDKRAHAHIMNTAASFQLAASTSAKQLKLPE